VKNSCPLHSSPEKDQTLRPKGIRIFEGKSGKSQADEGHHHHQVDEAVQGIKSPEDLSFLHFHWFNPFLAIHELS
jgi:hypothetical protein